MATLVKDGRVHLGCASLVLAIPFVLIFLLSLGKTPFTACVVIALFALAVFPSCAVASKKRRANVPDR
jgi:Kef-type K+ transport system membrane component KefB